MRLFAIILFIAAIATTSAQRLEYLSRMLDKVKEMKTIASHLDDMENEIPEDSDRVKIQFYYESVDKVCRDFNTLLFIYVYKKLQKYVDVYTYPYGNAKTIIHGDHVEFQCEHGPIECYGNMLHACAIDILNNTNASIIFNECLMDLRNARIGSDDATADKCGKKLNVNVDPIKECAKGDKGKELLKYYGDESHKAHYRDVPFVLINGKEWIGEPGFIESICKEFKVPPPPCINKY